ncbi:DUF2914 domain-containing protein [Candidatus Kaiserbacteria bacterium]|nr:DUF2914 domain-containing protein [Candidatus Kaiserbacteria bacterium]
MRRPRLPKDVQELVHWYERYVSPLSLVAGFVADNLYLLRRVDLWRSNVLLFSYLAIAAAGILFINMVEAGRFKHPWVLKVAPITPVIVQFAFGGLFSGYLSLYSRSAGVFSSWVFVVIVAALLIGNERFIRLYIRFRFQIGLYFTVLFSFLIFFLPVVTRSISQGIFLLSGLVALLVIAAFLYLMHLAVPELERANRTKVARTIAIIYIVFNILYFSNAIPPLPLALKDAGVYHSVTRIDDTYTLLAEPAPWYRTILPYNTTIHLTEGASAYVYTAIFAPTGLKTTILHVWQRYDDSVKSWQTMSTVSFPVLGGRDGGYRGYSLKSSLTPGRWRVNVLTLYGQTVGRVTFTVMSATSSPVLTEVVK